MLFSLKQRYYFFMLIRYLNNTEIELSQLKSVDELALFYVNNLINSLLNIYCCV